MRHADPLLDELLTRCTFAPAGTPVTCSLSGGPDSAALTALAVRAGLEVTTVHIHHGLRRSADGDAATAEAIAISLGVGFRCEHARLHDGPNVEARARTARRTLVGPDALTGHTLDDQAETLLLALLRGSGATGLAAMRPGPTKPILKLRRSDTHAVCDALRLVPAVDPTNADPRFWRNRIRHEVLPLFHDLAARDVSPILARTAALLRDDDDHLEALARHIDATDAVAVAAAPIPLARRALRRWLTVDGYPPDAAAIDQVLAVAAGRAEACEIGRGRRVSRSQQRLSLSPMGI